MRPLVPLGIGPNYCRRCYARSEAPDTIPDDCWACPYWAELDGVIPITYLTWTEPWRIGSDIYFTKSAPERTHIPGIAAVFHRYLDLHGADIWNAWGITHATYVPAHADKVAARGFDLMSTIIDRRPDNRDRLGFRPMIVQLRADEQPSENRRPRPQDWALLDGIDVKGARVVLTDDVITSGATTVGIARMLKEHGAEAVFTLAITRAVARSKQADLIQDLSTRPFEWDYCPVTATTTGLARSTR